MDRIDKLVRVRELSDLLDKLNTCAYRRLEQMDYALEDESMLASVREMVVPLKDRILENLALSDKWIEWVGDLDKGCSDQVLEALVKEGDCMLVLILHVSLLVDGLTRVIEQ